MLNITLSCINCNSLNVSSSGKFNQYLKIYGITKLRTDIIFLSDIRICGKNRVSFANEIQKTLTYNPYGSYKMYYNSSQNKRGVGILIKNTLNIAVSRQIADPDENFLLLDVDLAGSKYTLGSVYGPNNTNENFFDRLLNECRNLNNEKIVLAGDWNSTYSMDPVNNNIDCFKMGMAPNLRHSRLIRNICEELDLSDPYRQLYPNKKDFTYIPRATGATNRSRIDFFIVSNSLLENNFECNIMPNLQNKMFDHKACILDFSPKRVKNRRVNTMIDQKFLKDDIIDDLVFSAVAEAFAVHADPRDLTGQEREVILNRIGNMKRLLRMAGPPTTPIIELTKDGGLEWATNRERIMREITLCKDDIELPHLQSLRLDPDPDIFLETLLGMIKNELISYQAYAGKIAYEHIENLRNDIATCRGDPDPDLDLIFEKERQLNILIDAQAQSELEKFKIFDILNEEKITPSFMKIFKKREDDASLSVIRNDNGDEFLNNVERVEYITRYYSNLFKLKDTHLPIAENCIENFLGPDICNSSIVQNSKITVEENTMLNNPLSLEELDAAVKDLSTGTSCGPDGIGNMCIKKIWHYVRGPLFNYCNFCLERGELTERFKTASIRLIPKKGDKTKLKNWRPISLLNCIYKVVSKAINERLKKISNRILSRAQKGFTKGKYIQECLINISELISRCNNYDTKAFVLAIDQAKAFDSVRQDFMKCVYKFFGFPESFIKILELFTTKRTARIILDNGDLSGEIPLEIGSTQGNGPSPLQFNFCEQVMIFKIELDPNILSVCSDFPPCIRNNNMIDFEANNRATDAYESNRETDNVEGFADDASVISLATEGAIIATKDILRDFENISGLACNFEKSAIMLLGFNDEPVPVFIQESGFEIVDSVTILGVKFTSNPEDLVQNYDGKITKVTAIRNFWARFKLSLPGRLNIAKTFMLSQIGYLGAMVAPNNVQLEAFETIIYNFVKGSLNVAKDRITLSISDGGLGMINVRDYISGLQVSWFKKIRDGIMDNWRRDIRALTFNNPMLAGSKTFVNMGSPTLTGICSEFEKFKKIFTGMDGNLLESYLIENPCLSVWEVEGSVRNILARNIPPILPEIGSNLKIKDVWQGNGMKRLDEINDATGLPMNLVTYLRLGRVLHPPCSRINRESPAQSMEGFLKSFKKGSKKIRGIIYKGKRKKDIERLGPVTAFFRIINCERPSKEILEKIYGLWGWNFLTNRGREFAFKYVNNLLGTNDRVAHFNRDRAPGCTFCTLEKKTLIPAESFLHVFYECPTVRSLKMSMTHHLDSTGRVLNEEEKRLFWLCGITMTADANQQKAVYVIQLAVMLINHYIWECKLKHIRLSINSALLDLKFNLDKCAKKNGNLKSRLERSNVPIFSNWYGGGENLNREEEEE
jgi:exonuclease III